MADRLKYFLLGLLFLIVAGIVAYNRWNDVPLPTEEAAADHAFVEVGDPDAPAPRPAPIEEKPAPARAEPLAPPAAVVAPPRSDPPSLPSPEPVRPPRAEPIVEPLPATAPPHARDREHVVAPGESLGEIAHRYYGSVAGVARIVEANGLADANRIYVNQRLVIPAASADTRPAASRPAKKAGDVPSTYRVQAGENLYAICRKLYGAGGEGARVARIMELNGLWSAEVRAGTVLRLPEK